jgi:hypothetical protein
MQSFNVQSFGAYIYHRTLKQVQVYIRPKLIQQSFFQLSEKIILEMMSLQTGHVSNILKCNYSVVLCDMELYDIPKRETPNSQ